MDQVPFGFTVEATGREWSRCAFAPSGQTWFCLAAPPDRSHSATPGGYPLGIARRKDEHWFLTARDGHVSIDHSERTVHVDRIVGLPASDRGRPYDPVCERELKDLSLAWEQVCSIQHRDVAGYRVVAYSVSSPRGGGTVAFAPELGCMTMSIREVTKNGWRVPVTYGYWEVTAVRRGEPDPALLRKPAGYRVVEE